LSDGLEQYQRLLQQQQAYIYGNSTGSGSGMYGLSGGGHASTATGHTWYGTSYPEMMEKMAQSPSVVTRKVIKFFRVNEIVEVYEDMLNDNKLTDPIDELRIKVARWLNPKSKYNFA